MQNIRPTFYYKGDKTMEIRAGGVLFFYKTDDKIINFLMVKNRGLYEDFGGKTDMCDSNYLETISREVEEESNKIFNKKNIYERIKLSEPLYFKESKYLLFVIELSQEEQIIDAAKFGIVEEHDNIQRTVEYVELDKFMCPKFIKSNLNFRLKNKLFFEKINSLK